MSTVNLNDKTIEAILAKFDKQCKVRADKAQELWRATVKDNQLMSDIIAAWKDNLNITTIADQLPAAFRQDKSMVVLQQINGISTAPALQSLNLDPKMSVCTAMLRPADQSWERPLVITHHTLQQYADQIAARNIAINDEAKRDKASRINIQTLLCKVPNLKQALDVWPQLREIVPSDIWARHESRPARTMRASDTIDKDALDLDALNTTVVMNKIASST